jgi:hypothetical protein
VITIAEPTDEAIRFALLRHWARQVAEALPTHAGAPPRPARWPAGWRVFSA